MYKIQKEVDEWIKQYPEGYWPTLNILARLTEEVGELAREINHLEGTKKKKESEAKSDIESEIGDILFTLTCLANSKNISLDNCFKKAMDKCYNRDNNRFEKY